MMTHHESKIFANMWTFASVLVALDDLDCRLVQRIAKDAENEDRSTRRRRARPLSEKLPGADSPAVAHEIETAMQMTLTVLDDREQQIAEMLEDGQTYGKIGAELGIHRNTVQSIVNGMRGKLECSDFVRYQPTVERPNRLLLDSFIREVRDTDRDRELSKKVMAARYNLAGPRVKSSRDECPPCVLCRWFDGVTTMPPPGIHVDPAMLAAKLDLARKANRTTTDDGENEREVDHVERKTLYRSWGMPL